LVYTHSIIWSIRIPSPWTCQSEMNRYGTRLDLVNKGNNNNNNNNNNTNIYKAHNVSIKSWVWDPGKVVHSFFLLLCCHVWWIKVFSHWLIDWLIDWLLNTFIHQQPGRKKNKNTHTHIYIYIYKYTHAYKHGT